MINQEYKVLITSMKLICTELLLFLEEPEVFTTFPVEVIGPKLERLYNLLEAIDVNELVEKSKQQGIFSRN